MQLPLCAGQCWRDLLATHYYNITESGNDILSPASIYASQVDSCNDVKVKQLTTESICCPLKLTNLHTLCCIIWT